MLLHICCAPCSTHVINILKADYDLDGYFYNPNIHPESEYKLREKEVQRYADSNNIKIIREEYDAERWFELTEGMDDLPEGDRRCDICFEMRLERTAKYAKENGYDIIATTLSISPHKNAKKINEIGTKVAEKYHIKFLEADFKKKGGFERSIQMSKQFGLYRQSYCGCIFSKKEAEKRALSKKK
ncbi:TPA: epoxyqueuosine reductase QueH [Candidatus Poribacteria bacterium]|nr:epoxyqueuosine reductase QueH [Candidatus Poribacteria bacterium]